jgi:hypothetical protein
MAKSDAQARPGGKVTKVTLGPVPFMGPFGMASAGWSGSFGDASTGVAGFFADRLSKDVSAGQEMMTCQTLSDLQQVQMRYLQDMAADYLFVWPRVLMEQAVPGHARKPGASGLLAEHADDHMGV